MDFLKNNLLVCGIVFVIVFSLFYILYAVIMTSYYKTSIFNLFRTNKYEKLEEDLEESTFGDDFYSKNTENSSEIFLDDKVFGGKRRSSAKDRIKDLIKNPPSLFEKYVRDKIEKLTGHKFPTVYPSWLISAQTSFELDGYNKELGIAFETQGPQHYEFNKKYYANYPDYYRRILHDQIKRDKCEKQGIGLIIIDHSIPKHLLTYYIGSRLWDICREKSLIEQTAGSIKNLPYSKVNCALLEASCGIWGNIAEKPAMYMEKINRTPYRNYELEKQMVLEGIL